MRTISVRYWMSLVVFVLAGGAASADNFTLVSAGGNWSNTSIWLQNAVPATRYPGSLAGTPDSVSLTASFYTVTVDVALAQAVTLNTTCPSNTSTCVTDVPSGGNLLLAGGSIGSDAHLKLSGGTITNTNILSLNAAGTIDWSAGTLTGSGQISAASSSNINLTGSSMILTGGVAIVLNGTLTYGSVAGGFAINSGSSITVASGGLVNIQNSSGILSDLLGGANITVNSGGTFKKTAGNFGTNITPTLHNAGLVQTDINTLVITGGSHSGTFNMNGAGTGIGFAGTPALNNGTVITGGGTASFGNVTINGTVTATNVSMDSFGSIGGSGTLEVSGGFAWRGGSISTATVKMLTGSTMTVTGESTATLTGSGNVVSNGVIDVNPGVGSLTLNNGGFITNNGTLNLAGDVTITSNTSLNPRIDNSTGALILKNAGSGFATINVNLNNSGNVKSTSGSLVFNKSGVHTNGSFLVCDGCYFDFAGGSHTLDNTTLTYWNTGASAALKLAGATFNVSSPNGAYVGIDFFQFAGTVAGDGIFNVDANFTWSGGTHSGTGSTTLASGKTHKFDGANGGMSLTGRIIVNHGTLNYSPAGTNYLNINAGGTLKNLATFNLTNDAPINGDGTGTILNEGATFTKNGGSGLSTINAIFNSYDPVIIIFGRGLRESSLVPTAASINVNSGQVGFNAGGTNSASILVPNASNALVIGAGNYVFDAGTTTFPTDLGVIRVNGGTLTLNVAMALNNVELLSGTLTGSDLTINNKMVWKGGTLLGPGTTTISTLATLSHLSPTLPTFLNGRTLDVNGTADYEGSGLQLLNGATINNNAAATFNVRDGFMLNGAGVNTFNNLGTLKKIGTAGGMRFDVPVVNSGTVSSEVSGQSLIFAGGGSQSAGSLATTGSALIDFFGGTFTVNGGTLSGTGQHRVNGGTLQVNVNLGSPAITLAMMSGVVKIASSITFQVNSLVMTGGGIQGPGTLRAFGGSMANNFPMTLLNGATLTLAGPSFSYDAGLTGWLTILDTATLNVESGATFSITNAGPISGGTITSSGTFKKSAGNDTAISSSFTSTLGSVVVAANGLLLTGNSTISTPVDTGAAGALSFTGGTHTMNSGASFTGTGPVHIYAATFNANTALTIANLKFSTGTLGGSGSIAASSTLTLDNPFAAKVINIPLINNGTMSIDGSTVSGSGSITNNGTFGRAGSNFTTLTVPFTNTGTANFDGGGIAFNGGYTQTAGSSNLAGGSFASSSVVNINGGVLQGSGFISASVANNGGTVAPGFSPGILNITGNYTQGPSGILNIQLGGTAPGTGYDQLNVSGLATFGGTINVTLINAFTLSSGDVFNAVTYAAHAGAFAVQNLPPFPVAGGSFTATYTPAAYQLAAVISSPADLAVTKTGPTSAMSGDFVSYTIVVKNLGAAAAMGVILNDPTPGGLTFKANTGDCTTAFPCSLGTLNGGDVRTIVATYKVGFTGGTITNTAILNVTDANNANNTASAVTTISCPNVAPSNLSPSGTAGVSGTLTWAASSSADFYQVFLGPKGSGCSTSFAKTTLSSVNYSGLQSNTEYEWRVESSFDGCPIQTSACVTFKTDACNALEAPIASVVGEATSQKSYSVIWETVPFATRYEVDEATDASFADAVTKVVNNGLSLDFSHEVTEPKGYFYRVRPFGSCNDAPGPYSTIIRVVVVPPPSPTDKNPIFNIPVGSTNLIVQKIFIPGVPGQTLFYSAKGDRDWLFVTPPTGALPPQGVTLDVVIDAHELPNGTFTATVIVTIDGGTSGQLQTHGSTVSVPISVNLVTPVTPVPVKNGPSQYSLIVPAVGHINGVASAWQSDVRITNAGFRSYKYRLTFTPAAGTAAGGVKQTDVNVDAGATMALDDIVKNWYGFGSLGDGESGTLEIVPVDDPANASLVTVAASRTYNVTQNGTLGQFVPAVPFPSFVGKAASGGLATILSLQQIAQTDAYRTNVGIVEAQGKSASAVISVFNSGGTKLLDLTQSLLAGQQLQLNALLAQNNITLGDGRVEVKVAGGDGKITAYASVVDNATGDPFLVNGIPLTQSGSTKYVLPGAANINTGFADWRTDMRVFNYGTVPQTATLTFYPLGGGTPRSAEVFAKVGEVLALDNIVKTLFGGENTGGAVHVTTAQPASFIVSGRTYNQTSTGTLGQFITAVTAEQGIARGGRSLQILQIEDSVRYRANIGVTELSGKPATVEISISLPDSKATPTIEVPLAANEFRQLNVIRELNLGNVYNARVSVKVIGGDGRVTAFASLIDELTGDPAYIPGQ